MSGWVSPAPRHCAFNLEAALLGLGVRSATIEVEATRYEDDIGSQWSLLLEDHVLPERRKLLKSSRDPWAPRMAENLNPAVYVEQLAQSKKAWDLGMW